MNNFGVYVHVATIKRLKATKSTFEALHVFGTMQFDVPEQTDFVLAAKAALVAVEQSLIVGPPGLAKQRSPIRPKNVD